MKCTVPGHRYELQDFLNPSGYQTLQFIHKEATPPNNLRPMQVVSDGTTNEEVLAALIDRLQFLGSKLPCRENSIAITHLEEALMWLEKRTASRKARNVEGTNTP